MIGRIAESQLSILAASPRKDGQSVARRLPSRLSEGDQDAFDQLFPLVYDQLKQLARARLRRERPSHTLNTTALVHELYMKLINTGKVQWQDRAHFLAMASRAMRRILIDHARTRTRQKRGGDQERLGLDEVHLFSEERAEELLRTAGAYRIDRQPYPPMTGWHLLGTAAMGADPEVSVVDARGRCHGISNLLICDGSVFPTAGAVNPASTIGALALRLADQLAEEIG